MTTFSHLDPTKTDLTSALRGRGHKNFACTARFNQRDTQYSIRDTKHSLYLPKILVKSHLFMQNELEAKRRSLRESSLKPQTGDQFQPRYTRNGMIMQNEPNFQATHHGRADPATRNRCLLLVFRNRSRGTNLFFVSLRGVYPLVVC